MAAAEHQNDDAVIGATQLVQYEDDEDDKVDSHSDRLAPVSEPMGEDSGMNDSARKSVAPGVNVHSSDQIGTVGAEDVAGTAGVAEGDRDYEDAIDGGARHVYMETTMREEMVVEPTHVEGTRPDLASEAMRVFCSYDRVTTVGHTEDMIPSPTPGANEYAEEDLHERGLEEVALEERVHADQEPEYLPEEVVRVEGLIEHSSFSSMQQLQLRAQILVYGDLIKGVLPEESLMSSAFADANEVTDQESERSSGWNWEGPWQLAVEKEAERREAERLAEEERINGKGDVIITEGEALDDVAENLEPGPPSTSQIRVAEDPLSKEVIPGAMPEAVDTANETVNVSLNEQPAEVNSVSSELPVNLDAVVDNIVATAVNSIDSSLLKDSTTEGEVTRSPSLDPWLKPPSSQVPPAPGLLQSPIWATPVQTATVATPSVGIVGGDAVDGAVGGGAGGPEEDSRKRGRGRGSKTPASRKAAAFTTRRGRGKNASVAPAASDANPSDPALGTGAVPSRLSFEGAVIVQGVTPASNSTAKRMETAGRSNLHAETQSWLEQAKASFEEAVTAANSAAEQFQLVESATTTPKSGKESQVASAAAAVNAAAAVAKAAADAAKVAYEAALQASIMVAEGVDSGLGKVGIGNGQADRDGGLGGRRSAIAAAKEEARKRATAATATMKITPQSTDAVLRAAKMMAEAATQAGAVLAKGSIGVSLTVPPSPGSQGEGRKSSGKGRPRKDTATVKSTEPVTTAVSEPAKNVKGSLKKGARKKGKEMQAWTSSDGQANSTFEKGTRRQLEQAMASASIEPPEILQQSQILEGSLVEVMNDEEGLRGGWFSAKVLEIKTGEAYVQYDEILTDDGTTQLKEWFPLEGPVVEGEPSRPRIRVVSPNNIAREEGRRKKRRTTTGQKVWTIGDHVDAFVQDGWWEGVVKLIDDDDESKVTVHFPGEGDTSVVKSWNLRSSFVWNAGRWEQWSRDPGFQVSLGDGQQPKKQKIGDSPKVQARKSGRKGKTAGKVSDEKTESSRASRRPKSTDTPSATPVSPAITTRSSPRQKIPPKRKEGPIEVSTPTQVSTSVSTRTQSIAEEPVHPVKEPLERKMPAPALARRTRSRLSSDVEKSENHSMELGMSSKVVKNSEPIPSPVKKVPVARQKAKSVATPAIRRSARR